MTRPILEIKGLTTTLANSKATVLENVSFSLQPGEVLGVVGESGSGKSMLALSVMGLLPKVIRSSPLPNPASIVGTGYSPASRSAD